MSNTGQYKIAVVIPWRPQPRRIDAFNYVIKWYEKYLPSAELIIIDSDTEKFNLSRARNLGMKEAEKIGANVVIMNDADTVPSVAPLAEAIKAVDDGLMHNPYTIYRFIPYEDSVKFFNGIGPQDIKLVPAIIFPETWWGVVVFRPEVWWKIGGSDERIIGWGYEDTAMAYTHSIVFGKDFVKHDGVMYAFDHETSRENTHRNDNNLGYYNSEYLSRRTPDELLEYVKGNVINPL